ncbi:organic cation transporter protein-like [Dermacentor silvarum]|uniref:organic cation transporter protein-like n=1 Tax=Dermacentor silvarum TaxID=543639 RepID=UPI0018985B4D|nr:organic cation transporter protein-like [Dermacentor silvarum]
MDEGSLTAAIKEKPDKFGSAFILPGGLSFRCGNNSSGIRATSCGGAAATGGVRVRAVYGAHTAVNEFELVCDRRWLAASCQSLAMVGLALGALAFGRISDRSGRRVALLCGAGVHAVGSLAAALAPSAAVYSLSAGHLAGCSVGALPGRVAGGVAGAGTAECGQRGSLARLLAGAICAAWLTPTLSSAGAACMRSCCSMRPSCSRARACCTSRPLAAGRGRLDDARAAVARTARFNGLPRGKVQMLVQGLASEERSAPATPLHHIVRSRNLRSYTAFMWFQTSSHWFLYLLLVILPRASSI